MESLNWFTGGVDHAYFTRSTCMQGDTAWIETIMRYITGTANMAWVDPLYNISFIEKVLNIDAIAPDTGSAFNAEAG